MKTLPLAFISAAIAMFIGQSWKVFSPLFHGRFPDSVGHTVSEVSAGFYLLIF
ncbi:MAG: hypothetical protein KAH21_06935 [Spirochaetaceae bacterium]|nr:hypothetical protein [Spirochaetaceae bacterium]